ncbi:MAG TPA: TolC family protein, partial [Longimicrobiales bacterium]|nr:TolC family protein [Longimicrobiales bacterium]
MGFRAGGQDTALRERAARLALVSVLACAPLMLVAAPLCAQEDADGVLTLERLVELGLRDSYRVRQLQMGIDRTRALLRAEQAGLKSSVDLEITAPQFQSISEYEFDSQTQRNILVHQDTRRWEAELSIRQPVILFGIPTNGYLSLNNRMYRYDQLDEDDRDVRYYNRYFIAYEQPLFQPNTMRNDLLEAQLNVEEAELDYQDDVVGMIDDLAGDYFDLFEYAYERLIAEHTVQNLEVAMAAAQEVVTRDPTRAIEMDQLQVAVANAREEVQAAESGYRLLASSIRQDLRLPESEPLTVEPAIEVSPIRIDVQRAIELASTLAPRLRSLEIQRQMSEIQLEEARGRNGFRVDLELTYGREVQDPRFERLWQDPRNSYTVNVEAYVPIWDWGERDHRIAAQRISLERAELQIAEAQSQIASSVANQVQNLAEYQQRALNMQDNLAFARQITATTLERYRAGEVALVDVLQTIDREAQTA